MIKITNVNVYGLEESIIASGFPRLRQYNSVNFREAVKLLKRTKTENKHLKRAIKLGKMPVGSGHDSYLKGIIVQFNITYPQYFSMQLQRYHWMDIISSQSKMFMLRSDFAPEKREAILAAMPMNYKLTMRITTNYLQLKTLYYQRRYHELGEWRDFCEWLESLPLFMELLNIKGDKEFDKTI